MKIPLRYQNTEYDCGTMSFVNALAYLYEREDIPVKLLKAIYRYTLDVEDGMGGTSREHAKKLADYFVTYANSNDSFNIKCKILTKNDVQYESMKKTLDLGGVIIARCFLIDEEHYVIITKIDEKYAYIFDPYYLDESYYENDKDITLVLHETFSHNRKVTLNRLFSEELKDFSLLKLPDRQVILITK